MKYCRDIICNVSTWFRILRDSPSLRNYFLTICNECYQNAHTNMSKEYETKFPNDYPFSNDVETLLQQNGVNLKNV